MRKIWDRQWIILGTLLCFVAFINFIWMCQYFQVTSLIIIGLEIAMAVLVFMRKKNIALGILICILAAIYIFKGVSTPLQYVVNIRYPDYFITSGNEIAQIIIFIIKELIIAACLIFVAIVLFKRGKGEMPKFLTALVLYLPTGVIVADFIMDIINIGVEGFSYETDFSNFIYNMALSASLVLLVVYAMPNFKFENGKESTFVKKVGPMLAISLPISIVMFGLISWSEYIIFTFDITYLSFRHISSIAYIVAIVLEFIGIATLPFLIYKLRGNYPGEILQKAHKKKSQPYENNESYAQSNNNAQESTRTVNQAEVSPAKETPRPINQAQASRGQEAPRPAGAGQAGSGQGGPRPTGAGQGQGGPRPTGNATNTNRNSNGDLIASDGYIAMWLHVVLALFTFGVWTYIWVYKTTQYSNRAPGVQYYDPVKKLLLCIFVPFYMIYWYYRMGQRMERILIAQRKDPSDMAVLCLVFGIFFQIVAMILLQEKVNSTCRSKVVYANGQGAPRRPQQAGAPGRPQQAGAPGRPQQIGAPGRPQQGRPPQGRPPQAGDMKDVAEQLNILKKLLDDGILTQDEFDRKKAEILKRQ